MPNPPRIYIIAGPNGAGKTTFARMYLPATADCQHFVNADLIAAGLSPFAPEEAALHAGRLMLQEMDAHIAARHSFALETTLSGLVYARKIKDWQQMGYQVDLHFLALPNVDTAKERVALRVAQGGHHIPAEVIARRFASGLRNLDAVYKPLVNNWYFYEAQLSPPLLIKEKVHT